MSNRYRVIPKSFKSVQLFYSVHFRFSNQIKIRKNGNGHRIELWFFILKSLSEKKNQSIFRWVDGIDGTVAILDTETFPNLWASTYYDGLKKMNYEGVSRSLRYYYGKNILLKIKGLGRCTYCSDMKTLTGFSSQELSER